MSKHKSNIVLQTRDKLITHSINCGMFFLEDMQNMISKIHNTPISKSCLTDITYSLHETVFTFGTTANTNQNLTIEIGTCHVNAPCGVRTNNGCLKCIKNGKCQDKLVIDLIGKKLFADKYQGK